MPDCDFTGFPPELFSFLRELERHNERDWFAAHRDRYEEHVRGPALAFVRAVAPRLAAFAPRLLASDSLTGGSLLRLNRDVRFSSDKRPYHTSVALRFPPADAEPGWAPACLLRLTSRAAVLSAGIRPAGPRALEALRDLIEADPSAWAAVRRSRGFASTYGDLTPPDLVRVPRNRPADHPFAGDFRRKELTVVCELPPSEAHTGAFLTTAVRAFRAAAPLLAFASRATGLAWEESLPAGAS